MCCSVEVAPPHLKTLRETLPHITPALSLWLALQLTVNTPLTTLTTYVYIHCFSFNALCIYELEQA